MKIEEKFRKKQQEALELEKQKLTTKIAELDKYPDYGQGNDDNAREVSDFESNLSVEAQLKLLLKKPTPHSRRSKTEVMANAKFAKKRSSAAGWTQCLTPKFA